MKLIAATDKGLMVYEQTDGVWKLKDIQFIGMPVGCFHCDERNGSWWVAINHKHWGPKLYKSTDDGETFAEVAVPRFDNPDFTLKSIWTIAHGAYDDPNRLYLGVEPAAIFVTSDEGMSFQELKGLSDHPSRPSWQGGGKGSKNPFLHTILVDPEDTSHLTVGISCAGVFQSYDGGGNWYPTNKGLEAFYLPNSNVEVGHDPHCMQIPASDPQVVWQQNHCGVYRSEDKGKSWTNVSDPNGIASYGFAIVADDRDAQKAWVIPAQSDDLRFPYKNQLAVYQTIDGGKSWNAQRKGLPQNGSFDLILRSAFHGKNDILAFGTNNGNLYASANGGESWEALSQNLSAVRQVALI
ncbi:MAG: glycosyl hydrolase [Roseivirga sp.]|nr:glycosyl hydrolase [Roseivirga sp.]